MSARRGVFYLFPRAAISYVETMSAQLMATFDAVRTAVRTERTARAQGAASRQVHFAAVMGRLIDDTLTAPHDWNVSESLASDPNIQDLASRFG